MIHLSVSFASANAYAMQTLKKCPSGSALSERGKTKGYYDDLMFITDPHIKNNPSLMELLPSENNLLGGSERLTAPICYK